MENFCYLFLLFFEFWSVQIKQHSFKGNYLFILYALRCRFPLEFIAILYVSLLVWFRRAKKNLFAEISPNLRQLCLIVSQFVITYVHDYYSKLTYFRWFACAMHLSFFAIARSQDAPNINQFPLKNLVGSYIKLYINAIFIFSGFGRVICWKKYLYLKYMIYLELNSAFAILYLI